ncbi:hypothetical protein EAD89_21845 [Micromonospora sp. BL4]|uniref:hypothetical protein n=1 Tax=Micromonospora sp. BL4 TaxID=2478710 RepID=UPI000EF62FF2|nr:hypothetical protein [Micromonospora sp. BL4]RLP86210.1 hypothetical protein EAD89_21845 [Micromonospora sp. BL4]
MDDHDDQPAPDPTMTRIVDAVQLGRSGQQTLARDTLTALWDEIGGDGDAFHRCTLAHYLADLQESTEAELSWDERALAAVADLTDERAQQYHPSMQVQGFLPSLHLNLADDHRRLGHTALAREHLALAERFVGRLPDDPYGEMIRAGIRGVTEALEQD